MIFTAAIGTLLGLICIEGDQFTRNLVEYQEGSSSIYVFRFIKAAQESPPYGIPRYADDKEKKAFHVSGHQNVNMPHNGTRRCAIEKHIPRPYR
jgi:hypothetical protein